MNDPLTEIKQCMDALRQFHGLLERIKYQAAIEAALPAVIAELEAYRNGKSYLDH